MLIFVTFLLEIVDCSIREYRSISTIFLFLKAAPSAVFAKQLEYSVVYSILLLFTEYFITCKHLKTFS